MMYYTFMVEKHDFIWIYMMIYGLMIHSLHMFNILLE